MEEEKSLPSSTKIVIFTLPNKLWQYWRRLKDECSVWETIGQGVIAWSINEFINGHQNRPLIDVLRPFHDLFIAHTYRTLSDIDRGFWVASTKWSEHEVQITLSQGIKAAVPFWDRVTSIDEPEVKRFLHKGVLVNQFTPTQIREAIGTTMPGNYIPTMERQLFTGHYANPDLQRSVTGTSEDDYNFDHLFIQLATPDAFDGFLFAFKRFLKGEQDKPFEPALDNKQKSNNKPATQTWGGKPQRVSVEGKFFKAPGKVANEKHLPINQVYMRLYSSLPQWKDWYFIGTKKDPNCH